MTLFEDLLCVLVGKQCVKPDCATQVCGHTHRHAFVKPAWSHSLSAPLLRLAVLHVAPSDAPPLPLAHDGVHTGTHEPGVVTGWPPFPHLLVGLPRLADG